MTTTTHVETVERSRRVSALQKVLEGHTTTLLGLTVLVMLVFSVLAPGTFPTALNLQAIGYATPEIALLALAVAVCMSTGGIDLSIVATANLAALTIAGVSMQLVAFGLPAAAAVGSGIVCGLITGLSAGLLNGLLITRARIAPILATLATMTVFTGLALIITRGQPLYGIPDELVQLGTATIAIVPVSFWILLVVVAGLWYLMRRTRFGIRLILIGSSAEAADYTGLRRRRALVLTYALSGAIASFAGLLITARTASASADYGSSYLLLAITIAVLGGTRATGGNIPVVGVAVGAVLLQMVSSGFNLLNISAYLYQMVQGVILIVVLIVELRAGRRSRLWDRVLPKKEGG